MIRDNHHVRADSPTPAHSSGAGVSPRPTVDTWQEPPHVRWAFTHLSEVLPSARIRRRGSRPLSARGEGEIPAPLQTIPDLARRLEETHTDALLVVRGGQVRAQWYAPGCGPDDLHLVMSVSKSLCGLVAGSLVMDGLWSLEDRVISFVPELSDGAYARATIADLLDMTVSVDYDEDYLNPRSELQRHDRSSGWRTPRPSDPADTPSFLRTLTGAGPQGRFQYCSATTDVLAWAIERATGARYVDQVADRLWSRLHPDQDAMVTVDRSGFAHADGGISCTARDLARVGELVLAGGQAPGGRVVTAEWADRILGGGDRRAMGETSWTSVYPGGSYTRQWWCTGNGRSNVTGLGIHGQHLWLDPQTSMVIVKLSSWPQPDDESDHRRQALLLEDLTTALAAPCGEDSP
ncbi:serine hydrolase domain-containing protein [Nesterenkonia suensis]